MRIEHLAFSIPKAHSTGFLVLRSKLLETTSALLEQVSNSFKQNVVRGWITNNIIWNRSHARQKTLVSFWELRILQFSFNTRIGKHFCIMHTSWPSALYIQKNPTVIANSLNIKWIIVLRICRWSHYWAMCTINSIKCLDHPKLCFKLTNFHFHFLLITMKVEIMKTLALNILHSKPQK